MSLNNKKEGFVHSVKVPKLYKTAAKIVSTVVEQGGSLKQLLYTTVKANLKGVYALITKTIQHNAVLDTVIVRTQILEENPQLNVWLAKTLIAELLLGKGNLQGESKPVQTVWSYRDELKREFEKCKEQGVDEGCAERGKPRYVRVNTLHATCDEVIKQFRNEGWEIVSFQGPYSKFISTVANINEYQFLRDFHVKDLLIFPPGTEFHQHPLYQNATIILQDKASCLPPLILQPDVGSTVLDMCAAPGMKTTMLSAMMRGKGTIYAVERNTRRHADMKILVEAAGCHNVNALLADSLSLKSTDHSWCENVSFILVDPTCSGSGMTERAKLFSRPQTEERMRQLAGFQRKLLLHALTNFPSARRVVYSTCSVLTEENEAVVEAVMARLPKGAWSIVPALPEWPSRGSPKFNFGENCLTARPKEDLTTGFFIALFAKNEGQGVEENNLESQPRDFAEENSMKLDGTSVKNIEGEEIRLKSKKKKRCFETMTTTDPSYTVCVPQEDNNAAEAQVLSKKCKMNVKEVVKGEDLFVDKLKIKKHKNKEHGVRKKVDGSSLEICEKSERTSRKKKYLAVDGEVDRDDSIETKVKKNKKKKK